MAVSEDLAYSHPVWRSRHAEVLAVGGGALLPLAFAPLDLWPLAILAAVLLLRLWQGQTPWRAAWLGGLFGLGYFGVGISWVYISLHDYGNAPALFAATATFALILLMACYPALAGYALARWAPRPGPLQWLVAAPALWAVVEWVRGWLFSGFPWLALGYSQSDAPLANLAVYLGVFGVSWAIWVSAGLLFMMIRGGDRTRVRAGLALALLWLGSWGLGWIEWTQPVGEPVRVSLVQGNISQDQKWRPEQLEQTLRRYARLSLEHGQDSALIIWPEAAIPALYEDVRDFVDALDEDARASGVDYLIGIPSGSRDAGVYHNSVMSQGRARAFYHKHRLVPFGEYLPLRFLLSFFHTLVDIPMADFTPGGTGQALLQVAGQAVGVSICFEVVFGSEIRRTLPDARFLVNVSNDAWFGDSLAPHQHLQMARLRALEMGRYMARATNTGISAFIDSRGRIVSQSRQFEAEVLQGEVRPLDGTTPYARLGDGLTLGIMGILLAVGIGIGWREKSAPSAYE